MYSKTKIHWAGKLITLLALISCTFMFTATAFAAKDSKKIETSTKNGQFLNMESLEGLPFGTIKNNTYLIEPIEILNTGHQSGSGYEYIARINHTWVVDQFNSVMNNRKSRARFQLFSKNSLYKGMTITSTYKDPTILITGKENKFNQNGTGYSLYTAKLVK
ncbi:MAG TPA: hypothetical protein QF753_06765 [Victivallales bacterium]|nr:hypothetical protein [Victivallales bacterium]